MMLRNPLVPSALAVVLSAAACDRPRDVPPRLAPLADAPARAGVGLGDLAVGTTTLADVVMRYGAGHASLLAGDTYGYELRFVAGQLELSFMIDEELSRTLDLQDMKRSLRDLESFVFSRREVGATPLASLRVEAGRSAVSTFYRGRLDGGPGLFDPVLDAIDVLGVPLAIEQIAVEGEGEAEDRRVTRAYVFAGARLTAVAVGDDPPHVTAIAIHRAPE
jgi:hypothetical protein